MTNIDVPLLQKTLDWAHGEWQRHLRGEISEWNQAEWMADTALAARDSQLYGGDGQLHPDRAIAAERRVLEAVEEGTLCGTSCCIAGKVAYDAGWRYTTRYGSALVQRDGEEGLVSRIGAEELGLEEYEADRLFSGGNSIHDLFRIAGDLTDGEIVAPPDL